MSFDGINPVKKERAQQMVDFLTEPAHKPEPEVIKHFDRPHKKWPWLNTTILIIIIVALGMGLVAADNLSSKQPWLEKYNPLRVLAGLLTGAGSDNKMTILAMGIGGPGHDGPYLTDTLMVISLDLQSKHITLLSLPRDMVVKNKLGAWVRINSIYSLGRSESPEQGIADISNTITNVTGLNIDHYAIINFKGFVDFIDALGGITVNVDNSFSDSTFPTDVGGNVTYVSFTKGTHEMDGLTALRYARSRHGNNNEGSDFARSHRQQIILEAVREKLLKLNAFSDFDTISKLFGIIKDNFETNASIDVIYKIAKMISGFDKNNIHNFVITDGPNGLLEPATTAEGAMVLQPKDGNYQTLKRMVNYMSSIEEIKKENQKVVILNGTETPNLASQTAGLFSNIGFNVSQFGNAEEKGFETSVIYKISNSAKSANVNVLKEELKAVIADNKPEWLTSWLELHQSEQPDIVAIIGKNYADSAVNTSPLPIPPYVHSATSSSTSTATSTAPVITATSTTQNLEGAGGDETQSPIVSTTTITTN